MTLHFQSLDQKALHFKLPSWFLLSIRYDSNASASDSSDEGDDSEGESAKKKKAKTIKVVKEKKERKPRKEVREQKQTKKCPSLRLYSINMAFLLWLCLSRRSRRTLVAPKGRWVPTCFGWTPVGSASRRITPESPSQRYPRKPERCGDSWTKTRRRWDLGCIFFV